MTTMTITRALVELKKLTNEIENLTPKVQAFIAVGDQKKIANTNLEQAKAESQAQRDRVTSRIERFSKIQNAIHKSNAETVVELGGKKMTVLEAINLKKVSQFKLQQLSSLTRARDLAVADHARRTTQMEDEISAMAQTLAGNGNKISEEQLATARKSVEANKKPEIVGLEEMNKAIEVLAKEVSDIVNELDFVLSESNAVTKIEIAD